MPGGTRLGWLPPGLPKVPLDIAATGPKVIKLAARHAERVTFSVGADAKRLAKVVSMARQERCRQDCADR